MKARQAAEIHRIKKNPARSGFRHNISADQWEQHLESTAPQKAKITEVLLVDAYQLAA